MKKILIITLVGILFLNALSVQASDEVKVYLNGSLIDFDTQVEIVNGRTMVPVSAIFKALDMTVDWDGELYKVTAYKTDLKIELLIGSTSPTVNGKIVEIDAKSYIKNGRTMVPLRFVAESTGAEVTWDGDTRSVFITTETASIDETTLTYPIVDTGVTTFYSDDAYITSIDEGDDFYGQDANYAGNQPSYSDHGDGTITDDVTGMMWQEVMDEKMSYEDAFAYAEASTLGGYTDWRLPTIKELFSLIQYTGMSGGESAQILFIDTEYFVQPIGDTSIGEREIDAQIWSSTKYVDTTMNNDETVFGVNFIDGRIKGYPIYNAKTKEANTMYVRLVRGNTAYGENMFVDNGDGTISDLATGLMWQQSDDGQTRDWQDALDYAETLDSAGYDDWRLPNIKELQSIVDYSKSVDTSGSAAIDDLFVLSKIEDPNGNDDYGYYWSSTSHQDGQNKAAHASYVAFGEAQGQMNNQVVDVHGAGAVRSDPKSGDANDYPDYFGPQGDVRYVFNFVLSVRTIE